MNFARTAAGAGTAESRRSRLQMISEYLMSLLWGVRHEVECMPLPILFPSSVIRELRPFSIPAAEDLHSSHP
jgi:hypothetical protein